MQTLFVSGQKREVWLVNELGKYNLVLKFRKPNDKTFKHWLAYDVISFVRE